MDGVKDLGSCLLCLLEDLRLDLSLFHDIRGSGLGMVLPYPEAPLVSISGCASSVSRLYVGPSRAYNDSGGSVALHSPRGVAAKGWVVFYDSR
jgi:hypothetical protein